VVHDHHIVRKVLKYINSIEISALKEFLSNGGNLLIMFAEGGEYKLNNNLNVLIEEFGISVNNDCVVRTCFHKYFHPKEVLI